MSREERRPDEPQSDATPAAEPQARPGAASADLLSDVTQIYLNEIGQNPLLTAAEELYYARCARQGDADAREKMIKHNLRLVVSIAKHYQNRGVALLDLVEEGNLGLMHTLDKFDPERGLRFSTYATWWIRQRIEHALMTQSRTIRLPVHVIKELNTVLRARRHLELAGARDPSAEDIAHLTGLTAADVQRVLVHNEHVASLDQPLDIDPLLSIGESIADEVRAGPDIDLEQTELEAHVREWLAQLSDKHRRVIEARYGLNGAEATTLDTLATDMGLTRERVRQIQIEALAQLRLLLRRKGVSKDSVL